jgi:hypothetical protein
LLKKAPTLARVPDAGPINRKHETERPGLFSVSLGEFHRLRFEAVDTELTSTSYENLDEIQSIRVLAVEDSFPNKGSHK